MEMGYSPGNNIQCVAREIDGSYYPCNSFKRKRLPARAAGNLALHYANLRFALDNLLMWRGFLRCVKVNHNLWFAKRVADINVVRTGTRR